MKKAIYFFIIIIFSSNSFLEIYSNENNNLYDSYYTNPATYLSEPENNLSVNSSSYMNSTSISFYNFEEGYIKSNAKLNTFASSFEEENDWDNGLAVGEVIPIESDLSILSLCVLIYTLYIIRKKKISHNSAA